MSTNIASALIDWTELWKIILAALIGGTGVVTVFSLLLLGLSRGRSARKTVNRCGLYALSGLCGLLVVAVAALGVYAMTQKPSSPKAESKAAAGTLGPAGTAGQRAAKNS